MPRKRKEPTQRTEKGLEIPVPKRAEWDAMLEFLSKRLYHGVEPRAVRVLRRARGECEHVAAEGMPGRRQEVCGALGLRQAGQGLRHLLQDELERRDEVQHQEQHDGMHRSRARGRERLRRDPRELLRRMRGYRLRSVSSW